MTVQTTAKWGLRYYQGTDTPAGFTQQENLAKDVENNGLPLSGTYAAKPTAAVAKADRVYRATDTGQVLISDGTIWHEVTGAGDLKATARAVAPDGWLLCDGASLLRATYPALFIAIGVAYGSADGTHFNVPDLRGRTPVGADGAAARLTSLDALGDGGGQDRHTLSIAEMPAHTHTLLASLDVINVSGSGGFVAAESSPPTITGSTGGGGSHNNMQPYQIVNWIIKV